MQSRFDFRSPLTLFGLALVLFVVFSALWFQNVYRGPQKTFDDMLVNNLTTRSVTKNEFATSQGQTSLQRITVQLGADNLARSLVTVRGASGSATTETIGTKSAAYVRYVNIQDASKHSYEGVTNVWAKSGGDGQTSDLAKLFNQSLVDVSAAPVPPIGYVDAGKRAELLDYIHVQTIFTPDYKTVKVATVNGRQVYVYDVATKLAPYVRLMQEFGHVYGLTDLDSLSPNDYQSVAPVHLSLAVDRVSHQLLRVTLPSSGFSETYTDYGITRTIPLPKQTISTTELRNRLNAAH